MAGEWKPLVPVATHGGPTVLARIGVMRASNRHVKPVLDHHWGRRKLKREE
jgi:hypothetical protein